MYELIIANKNYSSWSLRPWVLMRELGIPFTETLIPFGNASGQLSIADVSPSGWVPCLKDGQVLVWDSLAIVEYLAERHADGANRVSFAISVRHLPKASELNFLR